jgi:hypothetical protein
MATTFNKFDTFTADAMNKVHNLAADALKVMLTDVGPAKTNSVKSHITEIAATGGYPAGGRPCQIASSSQIDGVYKLVAATNTVFTSTGPFPQFRYAVLYNSSTPNGSLIGFWDFGSEINLGVGNTFTVTYDAFTGILQVAPVSL